MSVKLHRCPITWPELESHPCWRVQKALDEMGVPYEVVMEPWPFRWRRARVKEATGQSALPALELDDGTWYRDDSKRMAERIRAGGLDSGT